VIFSYSAMASLSGPCGGRLMRKWQDDGPSGQELRLIEMYIHVADFEPRPRRNHVVI